MLLRREASPPLFAVGGDALVGLARRAAPALPPLALLCLYTALALGYALPRSAIENVDFHTQVALGQDADLTRPATLVHGFYPIGYPLLLRLGIELGFDVARFGQAISWLAGALVLGAVYALALACTRRSAAAATTAGLVLLLNPLFLRHAVQEGNHVPAAGLQLAALAALWVVDPAGPRRRAVAFAAVAGLALGAAYLVRHQALILLPLGLIYLVWRARATAGLGAAAGPIAAFALAFPLAAAPQIVPSLIVHGEPFYNQQAKNVWFGIYGQQDWVGAWSSVPDDIGLREVVALDPLRFATHWADGVVDYLNAPGAWPGLLYGAWLVGTALLAFDRRLPEARRFLLVGALALPIAATAMAWLAPHFLLVPVALQALLVAYLVHRAAGAATARVSVLRGPLLGGALLAVGLVQLPPAFEMLRTPVRTLPEEVNGLLRLAGMHHPNEVATNDPFLHAVDRVDRAPYQAAFAAVASPASADELLAHPAARSWRFLVLNHQSGHGDYGAVRDDENARPALTPLRLDDSLGVYCLRDCGLDEAVPVGAAFEAGVELVAYRLLAQDDQHAVLFYWRAERPLTRSYKVSVRTVGAAGQLVAQQDGVPQLWTHPTQRWSPGEIVPDFHRVPSGRGSARLCRGRCELAVVLYDAASGQPAEPRPIQGVPGTRPARRGPGGQVVLQSITG